MLISEKMEEARLKAHKEFLSRKEQKQIQIWTEKYGIDLPKMMVNLAVWNPESLGDEDLLVFRDLCKSLKEIITGSYQQSQGEIEHLRKSWVRVQKAILVGHAFSQEDEPNLDVCPGCGGPADNGHDRCVPPSPYFCQRCNVIRELSYRACEDQGACSTVKGECGTCLVCRARALIKG